MCKSKISELDAEISRLSDAKEKEEIAVADSIAKKIERTLEFVKNPASIWKIGSYKQRRAVLNLCFSEPISYDREKKFVTPKLSSIFNVFNGFLSKNTEWWTSGYKSWNTFTADLVETADFIENSGIIDCLIAIRSSSTNSYVNNTYITSRY